MTDKVRTLVREQLLEKPLDLVTIDLWGDTTVGQKDAAIKKTS